MTTPDAYGLLDEGDVHYATPFRDEAEAVLRRTGDTDSAIVALYRSPTLTDAEREAVEAAIGWIESPSAEDEAMPDDYLPITATLRGLLKRLGQTEHARSTAANEGGGTHERRE